MTYLVDSDWVIRWFRGHQAVTQRLASLHTRGLAISIITLAEVYEGVYRAQNPAAHEAAIADFLRWVDVLEVTEATCRHFAQQRARLRRQNELIGDFDLLIAATALEHNLVVLTNNRRHFERVNGLQVESV